MIDDIQSALKKLTPCLTLDSCDHISSNMGNDPTLSVDEALKAKLDDVLSRKADIAKRRAALAEEDRSLDRDLADLRAALRVFGVNLAVPSPERVEGGSGLWRVVRNSGGEITGRVRVAYGSAEPTALSASGGERPLAVPEIAIAKSADVTAQLEAPSPTKLVPPVRPPIRDIVLDRLKAAGTKGDRATPIRKFIERVYGGNIHEKTVGMTLYRLAKDGLVRRHGRTWFLAENAGSPGADTPGPEASQT